MNFKLVSHKFSISVKIMVTCAEAEFVQCELVGIVAADNQNTVNGLSTSPVSLTARTYYNINVIICPLASLLLL